MAGKKTNIKNTPLVSPHSDWDAVFQIIHEPAMIVSPDFNILHANLATQKAFGLSEQQLQGRHCYEIFHGTKTAPPSCPLAKLMATGRAQTNELEVEMLHGNYRVSCTPIFDENGKIKSIFHLASDVTERVQTERALRHATRLYATLSQVSQIIVRVKERDELFDAICRVAVEFGEFRMAWIGLIDDVSLQLNPISHAGYEDGYLQNININVSAASAFSKGPSGQAILKGEVVTNNDIESSQPTLSWRDAALQRGYRSSAAVPFRHMGVVIGTLNLYADESGFFSEEENALLKEIGMDISFALDNIEAESQRKQAQEKLKESLTILKIAEESAKLGGWSVDLKTNRVTWSNQVAAIHEMPYGFSPLIEEGIRFYAPEWREKMAKVFGDCAQNGIPYNEEMEIITTSGKRVWVHTMGDAVRNDQGEIFKVQGAFQDISERMQTEDALRINQEMFSLFMRYSPIHVYIKEVTPTESRVLQASDNYQEIIGIDGRKMIGKTMEELFPADFAAKITADDWAVVANGKVLKIDEDFNGRHYTSVKFPIVLGDKTLLAGYTIDITERRQAEEEIQKIARHYQALIEKAPDGIVLLNEQGNFKFVSPSAKIMFGFSVSEEMTGNPVQYTHPDDLPLVLPELGRILEDPAYVPTLQYRFSDKNGNWKWVESTFSNLLADPSVESIVINFRDITERKQAEDEIHQLNAELEQRVEDRTRELHEAQEKLVRHEKLVVLGQMSSSVGHELRNPLSVINSAVYYLKMIQPNAADDVKEYLGIIDQEVRTAEKIITDLLDFSRIKSVDREAVSVSELIRRTLERFPVPESVAVTIDVPPDLPQVFVDVHHMTQVLGNLTVNACQAMTSSNESTLIVGQLSLYSTVQNDMINITVKDNGVGISAENMKKIFEPLFTTKTKGIGLGLAVSQKLVAANEGRIEVESEAGKGTSFHVYLPIYGVAPVVARDKKESE